MNLPTPVQRVSCRTVAGGVARPAGRLCAEETAVALVYDGGTEAVMMATPLDLEDFALGFSLNEGFIGALSDLRALDVVVQPNGVEVQMWLEAGCGERLGRRRRRRAGPTGCGLCGVEGLDEALRAPTPIASGFTLPAQEVVAAMAMLRTRQPLNSETRAIHAAAFFTPAEGLVVVREDVGRHNALDKLAGALARQGRTAQDGAVLLTSRVSIELVQKAAAMGAPVLAAVSAPTALALRAAQAAGVCIAGVVRDDGLEIFTHPERLTFSEASTHGS